MLKALFSFLIAICSDFSFFLVASEAGGRGTEGFSFWTGDGATLEVDVEVGVGFAVIAVAAVAVMDRVGG